MKNDTLQIRIEPALTALIDQAVQRTGLTKSEVLRQGLRKGVPEVIRGLAAPPKRTLVDALLEMKGLEIPPRHSRMKRGQSLEMGERGLKQRPGRGIVHPWLPRLMN